MADNRRGIVLAMNQSLSQPNSTSSTSKSSAEKPFSQLTQVQENSRKKIKKIKKRKGKLSRLKEKYPAIRRSKKISNPEEIYAMNSMMMSSSGTENNYVSYPILKDQNNNNDDDCPNPGHANNKHHIEIFSQEADEGFHHPTDHRNLSNTMTGFLKPASIPKIIREDATLSSVSDLGQFQSLQNSQNSNQQFIINNEKNTNIVRKPSQNGSIKSTTSTSVRRLSHDDWNMLSPHSVQSRLNSFSVDNSAGNENSQNYQDNNEFLSGWERFWRNCCSKDNCYRLNKRLTVIFWLTLFAGIMSIPTLVGGVGEFFRDNRFDYIFDSVKIFSNTVLHLHLLAQPR